MDQKKFSTKWTIICVAPSVCLGLEALLDRSRAGPAGIWFPSTLQAIGFIGPLLAALVLTIANAAYFFRARFEMRGLWLMNFFISAVPLVFLVLA